MSRSQLYHEAKTLGWTTTWNKSRSAELRQYIDKVKAKDKAEVKSRYYENKKKKIKKKIRKHYKDEKFTYITNPDTRYTEILINDVSRITLLPDSTWNEIKRHINKKLAGQRDGFGDCVICCEEITQNVTCTKCSGNYCADCYINLFRYGEGIVTCPHCRYSFGRILPNFMIEIGVESIKRKLGKEIRFTVT